MDRYDGLTKELNPWKRRDRKRWIHFLFLKSFFWRKLQLFSMFFVHYNFIQLRYFFWNYFLNNFSLISDLLRLVYLLMVYSYFIKIIDQQNVGTFCDNTCFSAVVFYIASHGAPINIFFWTSFLFFFFRLFYLSIWFLSVLTLGSSAIY